MSDDPFEVLLMRNMAQEASITRPEVGRILGGRTIGEMAAFHSRHLEDIGPWPKLTAARKKNRKCQFPTGIPGQESFCLCGNDRTDASGKEVDPLFCTEHKDAEWVSPTYADKA